MGPGGPLVRFAYFFFPPSFSVPSGGGAPAIVAGDWRLLAGPRGRGWIRHSRAVLPVVARPVGMEGVAGGELRGGGGFGGRVVLGRMWFPIKIE